ncbi:unnamed protein product, partial [Durusdinium trenchii]
NAASRVSSTAIQQRRQIFQHWHAPVRRGGRQHYTTDEEAQQQRQVVGKECQWQMGCELEQWRRLLRQTEFSEPERAEAPGVDVREQEQVDSQCKQPERELEALLSH